MPYTTPATSTAGSTLTAAWLNTYVRDNTAVAQVCTSSTRPTGNALYEGVRIYETDTDRILYYNGSAWVIIGGTVVPTCRVYNSANISHTTSGTAQALTFNSERYDVSSMHSTSSNTGRITIPTNWAGKYSVGASVGFASNATGYRQISIRLNGTTDIVFHNTNAISGLVTRLSCSTIYEFAAGDYIEVFANQTSGGALDVLAQGNHTPEFYATWQSA